MNRQGAHDALLTWCSEMGSGDLDSFRRSCGYLELRVTPAARALSQLGHVEFDWGTSRFAVAPTTLTTIPRLPGRLLATGARPDGLISRLGDLAAGSSLDVEVNPALCHQFGTAPSTAYVDADPADAPAFCEAAGIQFAPRACDQIARLLPPVTLETDTVAHRPDSRFPHALVDPHTFEPLWNEPVTGREEGLWLYRTWGRRREMILRLAEGEPRLVLDPDYAPYLMHRPSDSDPIVEYREAHHLLIVNAATPLPRLHARSASLCSGRAPIRQYVAPGVAYDHYVNVDSQTAALILGSLGATA